MQRNLARICSSGSDSFRQGLDIYNYNYIEFAFFNIPQFFQLLRQITGWEIHGLDFHNLVVFNAG